VNKRAMNSSTDAFITMVEAALRKDPALAAGLEQRAAWAQGKGFGSFTVAHEINVVAMLLPALPRLVIDVGAHVGDYTAGLRRRFPDAAIHAFEPCQTNIAKLHLRFDDDTQVVIVPYGLSDRKGSAKLFSDYAGSGLASLTRRSLEHFNIGFSHEETVYTVRFADYWREVLHERQVDLLKLDIEGHELAALQGCGNALTNVAIVQFEFGGCNIDTRTFFRDFWSFFSDLKWSLYRIAPWGAMTIARYTELDEHFWTTNFIAINPIFLRKSST
jgi:FkbM family methyltransferase